MRAMPIYYSEDEALQSWYVNKLVLLASYVMGGRVVKSITLPKYGVIDH